MEYIDLVNEKDEVIGTTTKQQSHAKGEIHRIVAILVFDSIGKLYVQDHREDKKFDHSVGGHVKKGESYDDAAKREAFEELGITFPLRRLTTIYPDNSEKVRHIVALYECTLPKVWTFTPTKEVKDVFPMTLTEVKEMMLKYPEKFISNFKSSIKYYTTYKNR